MPLQQEPEFVPLLCHARLCHANLCTTPLYVFISNLAAWHRTLSSRKGNCFHGYYNRKATRGNSFLPPILVSFCVAPPAALTMDKSADLKKAMSYSVNHNVDSTAKRIPHVRYFTFFKSCTVFILISFSSPVPFHTRAREARDTTRNR